MYLNFKKLTRRAEVTSCCSSLDIKPVTEKLPANLLGAPTVEGAKVVCEVAESLVKGDKVIVFKKKRRKGYRRKNGHRQYFSKVVIKQVVA